ncbi:MAG TPA: chemotaxis protein CheW [Polyangia bacterium]|nr:chemotaxis protein CheW [Polyangia bacterium]
MAPLAAHQYVTFTLMGEEYALRIHHVREIISFEPITAIPSMPPVVRGVLNLRGFVVPVVDLPVKFGLHPTPLGPATYLVIVDPAWSGETVRLGLVTPELGRVIELRDDEIRPVPDFGTRIQSEYLRGVCQVDGRTVLFLDTDRLLSPAEILRITALEGLPSGSSTAQPDAADGEAGEAPGG